MEEESYFEIAACDTRARARIENATELDVADIWDKMSERAAITRL